MTRQPLGACIGWSRRVLIYLPCSSQQLREIKSGFGGRPGLQMACRSAFRANASRSILTALTSE